MNKVGQRKRIVLLVALGTIIVMTILANVELNLILNQSRLTKHEISQMRTYYTAQTAMVLAFDQLRTGTWGATTGAETHTFGRPGCEVEDSDIPFNVTIAISSVNNDPSSQFFQLRTISLSIDYAPEII
jgi:Tfp pilus assembly protein PilX